MLYGRNAEIAEIDRLLRAARDGRSAALLLRGEAGIGKTALLDYAADTADSVGARVVRCAGLESEAELPFAALHQLLRPFLHRLDALPGPQATALRGAFGLAEVPGTDRFLAGLATLTLLAESAEDGPLLCLVDDAQWLDQASAAALNFVGRRLDAEGVVLVGAARGPCPEERQPVAELQLRGLDAAAAADLLRDYAADLPPPVRDRLIAESAGNPLALIELTADGSPGLEPVPVGTPPGGSRVQDAFGRQVDRLPAATRTALLVAAADDTGEAAVVLAAADRLGAGLDDLTPAERAQLVRVTGTDLAFRHPLIRSAVYGRAAAADRVAAHGALAAVLDSAEHADRRAWHLAAAATGPDDAVAAELAAAAERALCRGGYAASSAAGERAARLTTDPALRGQRLAAAATTARDAGQLDRADELAGEAAALCADPGTLATLAGVRSRVEFERGTPRRACELNVEAAAAARTANPVQATALLTEAVRMAYFGYGTPASPRLLELLESVRLPTGHPLRPIAAASAVVGRLLAGDDPRQVRPLYEAVREIRLSELDGPWVRVRIQTTALFLLAGYAEETLEQTGAMLRQARESGFIGGLPHLLLLNAEAALAMGRLREASGAGTEGLRIAEDTGQAHSATNLRSVVARVSALTGDDERCVRLAEESMHYAAAHETGANVAMATLALCVLDLGRGRYESAYERITGLGPGLLAHPIFAFLAPPQLIEAAARSGRPGEVGAALASYELWVQRHQDRPVGRAIALRCRALLSDDESAERYFQAALEVHGQVERPLARARTALLYGEWLRRGHRRTEARTQLRAALRTFEQTGAAPWAERARTELRATGETVTRAEERDDLLARLTPQELQVARLAAAGLTNRDIGAQLFLSPRTVGYHLYKAYPKLGIANRGELARMRLT